MSAGSLSTWSSTAELASLKEVLPHFSSNLLTSTLGLMSSSHLPARSNPVTSPTSPSTGSPGSGHGQAPDLPGDAVRRIVASLRSLSSSIDHSPLPAHADGNQPTAMSVLAEGLDCAPDTVTVCVRLGSNPRQLLQLSARKVANVGAESFHDLDFGQRLGGHLRQ